MRVTILGSGTSIPKPDRASPGLAIDFGSGATALIDPSSGSLHRMEKAGLSVTGIRWVFVTHFHPDHIGDLGPLFFALRNENYFPTQDVTLAGPEGLRELYSRLQAAYRYLLPVNSPRLRIVEFAEERLEFENWTVRAFCVEHTANSLGFRFEDSEGRVFAYSGDTDYCASLVALLEDADVALVESAQPSALKIAGHLTPEFAGRAAKEAGVRRLILTHLYPSCDGHDLIAEVKGTGYSGSAEVAFDGMKIEV